MSSSGEAAKTVVRAFYDSYNRKDVQASFDAYISTNLRNHAMGGRYDRAGWLAGDATLFPAFVDFTFTVLDQVAEGDKVATRWTMGGTHTGEFFGLPASGKTAFLTGTSVDRVENGQIVEHWSDMDFTGFLQQMGNPVPSAVEVAHQLADE
jgi:steroid delta-isomerase-like uncharacterized protein